jgi:hypothetical protein
MRKKVHRRDFKKLHLAVETCQPDKIIYGAILTSGNCGDSPQFQPLLDQVPGPLGQVCGDSAYLSRANAQYVEDRGGVPFLKPKDNVRALALGHPAWRRMILLSQNHPVLFERQYHRRSNNESCNSTWKKWFGEALFSRRKRNQNREVQWKSTTYDIRYLVRFRTRKELAFGG